MSQWPSVKAKKLLAALMSIGWSMKRQSGSHRTLSRPGYPDFVFAYQNCKTYWPPTKRFVSLSVVGTPSVKQYD